MDDGIRLAQPETSVRFIPQMKFRLLWLAALGAIVASTVPVVAAPRKSSGSYDGTVHVKGYTRKDGTYVAPHDRTAPNSTKNDNWSTMGNVTSETGKAGTKPGDARTAAPSGSSSAGASSFSGPTTSPTQPSQAAAETATKPALAANISKVMLGMTKAQVAATVGEPNIKTDTSWLYLDRGWVRFKAGSLVTGIEAR